LWQSALPFFGGLPRLFGGGGGMIAAWERVCSGITSAWVSTAETKPATLTFPVIRFYIILTPSIAGGAERVIVQPQEREHRQERRMNPSCLISLYRNGAASGAVKPSAY
jgi:hypothetical protein